jgi:hypothetical protein
MARKSFYEVVTEAVNDLAEHGFDSVERVVMWEQRIREAAQATMTSPHVMEQTLRDTMINIYHRMVERGELARYHAGVNRFTLERLRPLLRAELDRRILASANLIRLNREASIQRTLQRFSGWSTSIPKGGSESTKKGETKKDIRKALVRLPFEERRVLIDQGHKLTASINEVIARDQNALALVWHSHWRQANYNYREDHKDRDGKVYAIKPNWALDKGLMKAGKAGYYEAVTSVGEEPFCRCYAQYIYNVRDLPRDMLTKKGEEQINAVR